MTTTLTAPASPESATLSAPSGNEPAAHRASVMVAVVPACNEADGIGATVRGLYAQTEPPDEILVVANNCRDDTAVRARDAGASVLEMTDNPHQKAGALNWALAAILPRLRPNDRVLVMDADSILDPPFLAVASSYVDRGYGGVGGTFRGGLGGGFVGHLQRNEYARYQRDVHRRNGRCLVLTGTATVFSVAALAKSCWHDSRDDCPAAVVMPRCMTPRCSPKITS